MPSDNQSTTSPTSTSLTVAPDAEPVSDAYLQSYHSVLGLRGNGNIPRPGQVASNPSRNGLESLRSLHIMTDEEARIRRLDFVPGFRSRLLGVDRLRSRHILRLSVSEGRHTRKGVSQDEWGMPTRVDDGRS